MKSVFIFILVLFVGFSLVSCSKKQETLDQMQQPMSPEELNRIKTGTQSALEGSEKVSAAQPEATVVSTTEAKLEPLPPSGPYKPSARDIQTSLKNAGYYTGEVDGKLGPKSMKAVEEFQRASGLTADGKVGPKTWAVLSKYLNASESGRVSEAPAAGD